MPGCASFVHVQSVTQLFASLEVRHDLVRHRDLVAGARIAAYPLRTGAHRERAEPPQLDTVAAGERRADLLEYAAHDPLDVAHVEVRVRLGEPLDQVRLGHA